MVTRFSDDLFNNTEGSDFIVRKRIPLAIQIFLIFAIAFVAIYITATIMSDTGSKLLFFVTLLLTIGSLSWFTIFFAANLRDLVLATEFQNAMLASAAQLSTRFCLITKRDGSIVYIDPGFQKIFPAFGQNNDRNIEGMFDSAGIPRDAIQKIILILQQNQSDRVLLPFHDAKGEGFQIMMSIDLLPRPKGYFLMRGRDYVEKRNASEEISQSAGGAQLASALNMLPDGILVADGSGIITYANRALQEWLGFKNGELMMRPYNKTGQIFYQYPGYDAGRMITADYDGEIILQRKDRSLVTMIMRQASLGKGAGISAIILPATPKQPL